MKQCNNCGHQNDDAYMFCEACGAALKEPVRPVFGGGLKGSMGGQQYTPVDVTPVYIETPDLPPGPGPDPGPVFDYKKSNWFWPAIGGGIAALLLVVVLIVSITGREKPSYSTPGVTQEVIESVQTPVREQPSSKKENQVPLSDSCDYILCSGTDHSGNTYELVANQTESALGYEISVGIIKNNEWLYPLSTDFPFLSEDGLFHVSVSLAGESGTSLTNPNEVIKNLYFIDSGAFMMDSYKETDSWVELFEHTKIIFSCTSLKSYTVDCDEATLLYMSSDAEFMNGHVLSYGRIYTEDGRIILYSETSGTRSGWLENQVFDWCTLDAQTLEVRTLATNVAGVRPESILSEGLIFASDKRFYNTSGQAVIDLSAYDIDMFYDCGIYFENGTCTFEAENDLGTEFLITIDTAGNVLSEVAQ